MSSILKQMGPLFWLGLALMLTCNSCKTSNDVVSNGFLQKRKYRPGFHMNWINSNTPSQAVTGSSSSWKRNKLFNKPLHADRKQLKIQGIEAQTQKPIMEANRGVGAHDPVFSHRKQLTHKGADRLSKVREERTEELRTIKKEKRDNLLSILNSALIVATSLAVIISHILSPGTDPVLAFFAMVAGISLLIGVVMLLLFIIERFVLNRDRILLNEVWKTRWKWFVRVFRWVATILGAGFVTSTAFLGLSLIFFPDLVNALLDIGNALTMLTLLVGFVGSLLALPVIHRIDEIGSELSKMVGIAGVVIGILGTISFIAMYVVLFTAF
jgi:hypothetical protein